MTADDDLSRLVEFRLLLSRLAEDYLAQELGRAARAQGRRLPPVAVPALRAGAVAAVARLTPRDIEGFASAKTWSESLEAAVRSGAWARLLEQSIALAFPAGPT